MELRSKGYLNHKEASFHYDLENDGSLNIVSDGVQRRMFDLDVLFVIEDKSNLRNGDDGKHHHHIFHVVNSEELTLPASIASVEVESLEAINLPQHYIAIHSLPICSPYLLVSPEDGSRPNLHVIISCRSGIGDAQSFFDVVLKAILKYSGLDEGSYLIHVTESESSISELTSTVFLPRANEGTAQTILLLSGDGGMIDIINVLLSSEQSKSYVKPVIGLLALGTGNALSISTGLQHGFDKGVRNLFHGQPHSVPTFTAFFSPGSEFVTDEGRNTETLPLTDQRYGVVYGAVVCSWALHASLVAESDTMEYRKFGRERFAIAAKELVFPPDSSSTHVYKGKITLLKNDASGKETSHPLAQQEHMYVLASLVSNLEAHFKISPRSNPLDGQLRLLHLGVVSGNEVMRIMGLAYQGGLHVKEEGVDYEDIDGFRIDFNEEDKRWRRVCIDGKIVRVNKDGWVEIRKERRDVVDILVDLQS